MGEAFSAIAAAITLATLSAIARARARARGDEGTLAKPRRATPNHWIESVLLIIGVMVMIALACYRAL